MPVSVAEINLHAIRRNVRAIREKVGPGVGLMPAVKANAYGHGAVKVSRAALEAGVDMLGVACIEEAVELRDAGIKELILGAAPVDAASEIVERNVTAAICDEAFARALSACASSCGKTAKAHIKVDTGMGRVGVPIESALDLILGVAALPGIVIEGVFTHFPSADEEDSGFTKRQLEQFGRLIGELESRGLRPRIVHAANSAAILDYPESSLDLVRPGIMFYGLYPSSAVNRSVAVTPALTLKTRVVFLKEIQTGATVSYGRTFRASRRTKVATIPIGYADGYSRSLSNRGQAIVRGRKVPVIGRVCMDQTMLDVTDVPGVQVGDEVVVYGDQGNETIGVEDVAAMIGTIPYDVLCAVGSRIPRVYID